MSTRPAVPAACELSIVAPIYNDADCVDPLVDRIQAALEPLGLGYEILLVDDRSADQTPERIRARCQRSSHVRGLRLARNYGQQLAVSAGIQQARGSYVLVMDGDLQNPPEAIPELYRKAREGYDVVYTVSRVREDRVAGFTSRISWLVMRSLLRAPLVPHQLMMRIMSRRFVDAFNGYRETSRVVAGICADIGMTSAVLEVQNVPRPIGRSHHSFFQRLDLFIDLAMGLSTRPLTVMIHLGLLGCLLTALLSLRWIYYYLAYDVQPGYTSVVLVTSFFGCLIVVMIGVIGRYLATVLGEVRGRPLFLVDQSWNL